MQSENLKVYIKVSDEYTLNKNVGILYYWTNSSGIKVSKDYTYNYKNKKGVKSVTYQIPTKNIPTDSGEYNLVVRQWISPSTNGIQDVLGIKKIGDTIAGIYKIDNTKPSCGAVTGASTQWTNKNRIISVECNDSHSGCVLASYSNTYTTDQKTSNITIKDKLGNSTTCPVDVYIDKTKPSISVKFTRKDNGTIYSSGSLADVTIVRDINYSDNLSGVRTIQYNSGGGWFNEANIKNYMYTADTVNQYIKFRAIDRAGNSSETSQYHVRIEKDADKNYKISCSITCHGRGCGLPKPGGGMYYNDSVYKWNLAGAKSGINRSTMGIDYSTDHVHNYCLYTPSNAPQGSRRGCGYAIFNSTTIDYSRSYACSSIVGRACTNKNKCGSCTIRDRIGC